MPIPWLRVRHRRRNNDMWRIWVPLTLAAMGIVWTAASVVGALL